MSQHWPGPSADSFGSTSTSGPDDNLSGQGSGSNRLRPRVPRRSVRDRKIAGVAGGIGRALGIDPLLIRIAFVVLTVFGGFGALLYVLGWLLLPADGDDVSAAQALIGRGRSSVPPGLAVVLAIFAVGSLFSTVFWGFPFLPVLVVGVIVLLVLRRRRRWAHWQQWGQSRWQDWNSGAAGWSSTNNWMQPPVSSDPRTTAAGADRQSGCGRRAQSGWAQYLGESVGDWTRGWTGNRSRRSPFDRPAFWEHPGSAPQNPNGTGPTGPTVDMSKSAGTPTDSSAPGVSEEPRTTPPAWDPLGAAPFAWDLPEPTPLTETQAPVRSRNGRVIARVTTGLAFVFGAVMAAGILAGWWALPWASVAATALAVVGVGLLVSALMGRGYALIGPGVFLSLVTLALTMTGITGTDGYGDRQWAPMNATDLSPNYTLQAGHGHLDLTNLKLAATDNKTVTVQVNAGRAEVDLPKNVTVNMTCKTLAGHVNCNGQESAGLNEEITDKYSPSGASGTLNLVVEVRAGEADVQVGS